GIERIQVSGEVTLPLWAHSRSRRHDLGGLCVDIVLTDDHGTVLAEYSSLRGKVVWQSTTGEPDRIDSHFHRLGWEASRDLGSGTALPSALRLRRDDLLARLESAAKALDFGGADLDYQCAVHALCAEYVWLALGRFGMRLQEGTTFSTVDCAGLRSEHVQAFERYLGFLISDGVLIEDSGTYEVVRVPPADHDATWSALLADHPARIWELLLVRETGTQLYEVLTGAVDPLRLMFADGVADRIAPLYETSPISRHANGVAVEALRSLAGDADPRRTLRVLEVGAGTGGLTASVLPVLPIERCEYTFTDVSPAFLQKA